MSDETWRQDFIVTRSITNPGERAALYRMAGRGEFIQVIRGVYLRHDQWAELDADARHLARMRAHELVRPGTVFSHASAALVWGLPIVATHLVAPHALAPRAAGGRSRPGLIRHTIGIPIDTRVVDGLRVTSPAHTALHVAARARPETSIPILDAALARSDWGLVVEELLEDVERLSASEGPERAKWALRFAEPASGSAGESLSRVAVWRQRLPAPRVQCRFDDSRGLIGIVDFFWPDCGLVGEFDGRGKYLRDEMRAGREVADVVMAEKRRENRLRALGLHVARWEWSDALNSARLGVILREAGLRAV